MELDFAILAEKAETSRKGLLQLFGGALNVVNASDFPALAQLAIASRFVGSPEEAGTNHILTIAITNPAGERTQVREGKEVQLGHSEEHDFNRPAAMVIVEMVISFMTEGPYAIHIGADGHDVKELRVLVKRGGEAPVLTGHLQADEGRP